MSPKPAAGIAASALIPLLLAAMWPARVPGHRRRFEVGTNDQAGALFRVSLPSLVARQRVGRKPATEMPSA